MTMRTSKQYLIYYRSYNCDLINEMPVINNEDKIRSYSVQISCKRGIACREWNICLIAQQHLCLLNHTGETLLNRLNEIPEKHPRILISAVQRIPADRQWRKYVRKVNKQRGLTVARRGGNGDQLMVNNCLKEFDQA